MAGRNLGDKEWTDSLGGEEEPPVTCPEWARLSGRRPKDQP
jgi:hypothetical protein